MEAAEFGTLAHHWKETGETDPPWASDRGISLLERKLFSSGTRREDWWVGGEHEVSFAISLVTLQLEKFRGAREDAERWKAGFAPSRHWLTGTIDWVGETPMDRDPWIDDFKTGKWPVHPDTKQLLSYGMYSWLDRGRPKSWVCLRSITQWPIYRLRDQPRRTYGELMRPIDMECHLDDLRWTREHPEEVNPEAIYVGPWDPEQPMSPCAFCPCRPEFPVATWMTNYRYRSAPHCIPGMLKVIKGSNERRV